MKGFFLFCLVLLLMPAHRCQAQSVQATHPERQYKVVAYVFGHRVPDIQSIPAEKITHINYAFANIKQGRIIEGHNIDSLKLQQLNMLKQSHPHLKVLISIGGWSWSDHFSDVALTDVSREKFANSAVDFLVKYQLDGVDLDWEYPGQPGEDNTYRKEDKQNFTLLLSEVRKKLDAQSKLDGKSPGNYYQLTIASAADQSYLDHTEMSEAHKYLDFINIMTYDFFGPWNKTTGHHTNLFPSDLTNVINRNAQLAVNQHLKAAIPAHKLVLGTAFYGRGWEGVENTQQALYSSYRGKNITLSYDSLATLVNTNGYQRHWDDAAKAPYLWHEDSSTLITYDDPESLKHKCDFVKSMGLGGVMFWEYSHDTRGALLEAIHTYFGN